MKTKELIRLLQETDPSGEEHCCVDNIDIVSINKTPAYYDGCREEVILNESGDPISAKIIREGYKINISTLSIQDLLYMDPGLTIMFKGHNTILYENEVYGWRIDAKKALDQVRNSFLNDVLKKYKKGYFIVQDLCSDTTKYNLQYWFKDNEKKDKLCQGECSVLFETKFFKPVEKEDIIIWEIDL